MPAIDLSITRHAGRQAVGALALTLTEGRVELAADVPIDLDPSRLPAPDLDPEAYGEALTTMVFPPELRVAWQRARDRVAADGTPACLRLRLAGDDALHALCWELLRDLLGGVWLACDERLPLSRFLPARELAPCRAHAPGVRAVVAAASPAALPTFGFPPLDLAAHVRKAQSAEHRTGDWQLA